MTVSAVEKLMTVDEVVEVLRVSRTTLHQLVREGKLKAVKFGRRTLFRATSIQSLIESHETSEQPAHANLRGV